MSVPKLVLCLVVLALVACGGAAPQATAPAPLADLRALGRSGSNLENVGRWALAEMLAPGGDAKSAAEARKKLGTKGGEMQANLARALYDEAHGEPKTSADAYVATLEAARGSRDPDAPLVAWFAAHHLLGLRGSVVELYAQHRPRIEALTKSPGALGWRAVAELVEWSVAEAFDKAEVTGDAYDVMVTQKMGCSQKARIAGPFGKGTSADRRRAFPAERPGPWPPEWAADPMRGTAPHVLKSEQHRCLLTSSERAEDGVYYVETFVTTPQAREVILAVQGALKLWVNDTPVLERDLRDWGAWQRFGAHLRLPAGRSRVVARVLGDNSSVRVLAADGTSAGLQFDVDGARAYSLESREVLASPNPIDAVVTSRKPGSPLVAALASYLAYVESMSDVASVLIEPLVVAEDAGPVALAFGAGYARGDVALPEDMRQRTERDLHSRALKKDPRLWYSRAWLVLDEAEQRGAIEAVAPLRTLTGEFPNEPEVGAQLARVYGKLGWRAERMQALADLAKRFPDDVNALRLYLGALEEDGAVSDADAVAARVRKLDPDAEIDLERALGRHDYKAAIAELQRLARRRPDRKELATRMASVLARAGDPSAAARQLEKALAKNPEDSSARLRIADSEYARGDAGALRRALAAALQSGAKGVEIHEALDLIEGASNLEPYRVDGKGIIREFEAWEKSGKKMAGNAARVLDYSAIWVHPDGSSEMLEHEILRVQSQEAIQQEAEQAPPTGLVLRLRVLKPDGSQLEPEPVSGKRTLTMPHLEVGDYIEIEHVTREGGDGQKGKRYRGPHWFFREADKGYWRSEFVCLTPKDRPVEIETLGNVPPPKTSEKGTFVEHRWRVDESPPAPEEPDAARAVEFLPSVRVGWGITLRDTIDRLVDAAADETPLDPRLHKRALEIVREVPERATDDRARVVYKFVLDQVEDGPEQDGRRVILGHVGSRKAAFEHLMRQLRIPIEVAVVKNRLAMPPLGKMSEVEQYDSSLLRIETEHGPRWLTVHDKFAPYGYVPAEMRGQPAIRLVAGTPSETVTSAGGLDGIIFEGRADLREDGSATMEFVQSFNGKVGIAMRNVFDKIAETQVKDFVESRLLGRSFPGARLRDLQIENKKDLLAPLVVRVHADVPQLARPEGKRLVLRALFPMHVAQLAALPSRQTPMLLASSSHAEVRFTIVTPESVRMPTSLPTGEARDGERFVVVKDAVHGHALTMERTVDVPAGRVQPGDEYARFANFTQKADALLERDVVLGR
jgi:tetratricopeptide (TPR) repeat protein